jgi:hypothetical protein
MKRYVRLLGAITFLFGLGVAAKAETRAEIVVTLPFGFVVGGKTLPAGTYTVSRWSGDNFGSLMLTSRDNRASVFLLPSGIESASADKPQVSFQQVGDSTSSARFRQHGTFITSGIPFGHHGCRHELRQQRFCLRKLRRQLDRWSHASSQRLRSERPVLDRHSIGVGEPIPANYKTDKGMVV